MQLESFDTFEEENEYNRVMNDIRNVEDFFRQKVKIHRDNWDLYKGKQWTDPEIKEHEAQYRLPYVFNEVKRAMGHLIGVQTQTRLDTKCEPREPGDDMRGEIINYILKFCEQVNNVEMVETNVFSDGIMGGAGASVVYWNMDDVHYGYPALIKIPIEEMVWDINSKNPDLSDARWMARVSYLTKQDALEILPEYAKEIKEASFYDEPLLTYLFDQAQANALYEAQGNVDRQVIRIIEHYERYKTYEYIVMDDIRGEDNKFDTEADAQEFYNGLTAEYTSQGETLLNPDGTPKIIIIDQSIQRMYQRIVISSKIAGRNPLQINASPYDIYFSNYYSGDYWGEVDAIYWAQIWINRGFSQWDFQLGTQTKNAMTLIPEMLHDGFTPANLAEEISKTAPIILVNRHDALKQLENIPVNPDLFKGILFARGWIVDMLGGQNAFGLQENAAESGKAVQTRVEAGGIIKLPLFDRLRQWRLNVTYKMVWYITNVMSNRQMLRILGSSNTAFTNVDTDMLDTIKNIKYDITIDEAAKAETIRERYFMQIIEIMKILNNTPDEVKLKLLTEYSALPKTVKDEMLRGIGDFMEFSQKKIASQEKADLEKQVEESLYKRKLRDQLLMQEDMESQKEQIESSRREIEKKLKELENTKNKMALLESETGPTEKIVNQNE